MKFEQPGVSEKDNSSLLGCDAKIQHLESGEKEKLCSIHSLLAKTQRNSFRTSKKRELIAARDFLLMPF